MPMGSQDFWYNPTWGPENGSILISLVPTSASPGHKCCKSKISSPACMPSMQDRQGRAGGGGRKAAVAGRGRPSLGSRKRSSTGCSEPNATCKKAVECTSCGRCKFHLCDNCSDCEGDFAGQHVSPKSTRRSTGSSSSAALSYAYPHTPEAMIIRNSVSANVAHRA